VVVQYHICDYCGKKITKADDVFVLQIRGKYDDTSRGNYFELCAECATKAIDYYALQKVGVVESRLRGQLTLSSL
jgi:hypothetical protein